MKQLRFESIITEVDGDEEEELETARLANHHRALELGLHKVHSVAAMRACRMIR